MKKSQLKTKIRESIKQLMTEQSGGYTKYNVRSCTGGSTYGAMCLPNSANAQIGDVVTYPSAPPNGNPRNYFIREINGSCNAGLYNWQNQPFITSPSNCPNCCSMGQWQSYSVSFGGACTTNQTGGSCTGGTIFGCMDSTASNYDPTATVDDGSCTYTNNSHYQFQIILCDASTPYVVGQTYTWAVVTGVTCNGQMCTDTGPGSDPSNPNPAGTGDIGMSFESIYSNFSNTGPNWIGTLLSVSSPMVQTISPTGAFLDFESNNCPPPLPPAAPLPDPCKQFIITYPTLLDQKTFCKDECGGTTINLDPMCDCCRELREGKINEISRMQELAFRGKR